jgi:Ser/Thr protein kinase RdoA (MazF antagonist)
LEAALFFLARQDVSTIVPFGTGNINDTFEVTLHSGEQCILQRLNPEVFPSPESVMQNTFMVLDHLGKQMQREVASGNGFIFPTMYEGKTGSWYMDGAGAAWRLMSKIRGSHTCRSISTANQARELGKGLGFFHRMLSTLAPEKLADTVPGFHNAPGYLRKFDEICSSPGDHGTPETDFCFRFIDQRRSMVSLLEERKEKLQHGIIHGDPKVSNFLFGLSGERVISLIDLDTVRPGLLLYDLGDALRSCCNPAGETAGENEKIFIDPELFKAWLQGYFSRAGFLLSPMDREQIVNSARLISFELGLRFFSDYLAGNSYFKIRYPEQNLDRATVQFSLVRSIEQQQGNLETIVRNLA